MNLVNQSSGRASCPQKQNVVLPISMDPNGKTKLNPHFPEDVNKSYQKASVVMGASIYDVRNGWGEGVPKKQMKGTKSADL